jgi:ATP diphosphatase
MAEEQGSFAFGDVVRAITEKLIRRHPHVFGDKGGMSTGEVNVQWDQIKAQEKEARKPARAKAGKGPALVDSSLGRSGALSGVPAGLPALARALKLQQKASKVGFDWNSAQAVIDKIREETGEIEAELANGEAEKVKEEVGDLLFVIVNLARHLGVDPETALRMTNLKVERRFAAIEDGLAKVGKRPEDATLAEMDALWDQAKARE